MFGWFKGGSKNALSESQRLLKAVQTAVPEYGAMLERYPLAFLDSKQLPLPKEEMKAALKAAWKLADSDHLRDAIEVAYMSLGRFHDGIGDKPIDPSIHAGMSPAEVLRILNPATMEWQRKSSQEMEALKAEFDAFKQQRPAERRR